MTCAVVKSKISVDSRLDGLVCMTCSLLFDAQSCFILWLIRIEGQVESPICPKGRNVDGKGQNAVERLLEGLVNRSKTFIPIVT